VEKKLLATPAIQLLKPFSYLLTEQAKKKEIGKALAVVSNALKYHENWQGITGTGVLTIWQAS